MTTGVIGEEFAIPAERIREEKPTGLVWEEIACPLCHGRDEELVLACRPASLAVRCCLVRCRRCRMVYLNPRPNEASIGQLYPQGYECYQLPRRPRRWGAETREHLRQLVMALRYSTPVPRIGVRQTLLAALAAPWFGPSAQSMTALPFRGSGRLLDYGCGSGWYAYRMKQLGWDVTAMDFSAHAVAQVRRRFGIRALAGTLPHPQVRPASFDVITMGAVLEHVHDPHEVIAAAAEALRPGGYLAISVPNFAGWGRRHFRQHWWGLQLPHHLLHFTPDTLRRLLASHGLEVRSLKTVGMAGWMRRSLAEARANGKGGLLEAACRWRLAAHLLVRWTAWNGRADSIQAIAYRPGVRPVGIRTSK